MLFSFYFFFPIYLLLPSFFLSLSLYFTFKSISHRYFFLLLLFYYCCRFATILPLLVTLFVCANMMMVFTCTDIGSRTRQSHLTQVSFQNIMGFCVYKYISVQIEKYFEIRHTQTPGKVSIAFTHSWLYYVLPPVRCSRIFNPTKRKIYFRIVLH